MMFLGVFSLYLSQLGFTELLVSVVMSFLSFRKFRDIICLHTPSLHSFFSSSRTLAHVRLFDTVFFSF